MKRCLAALAKLKSDVNGAAMIEMAVVFPVLFAIGLGVFEFGNLIYGYHLVTNGVRDAARYRAGLKWDNTVADDEAKCIAMTGGLTSTDCSVTANPGCTWKCRVSWWNNPNTITVATVPVGNDDGAGNKLYRGGTFIYTVTVTARVPYNSLGFLGYFGLSAPVLQVSHEERVIGIR